MLGMEAPETLTAAGYTYRFAGAVSAESDRTVSDELAASDRPRLLTWATTGADDVEVEEPYSESYRSLAGDFEDWLLLPAGPVGEVVVRGQEPGVALAVYELTDEAPPGVSGHGVTFRSQVPGARLLAAGFAEPGVSEVEVEFTMSTGDVRVSGLCAGVPDDLRLNIDVGDRRGATSMGCGEDVAFDPGAGGGALSFSEGVGVGPGATTTARAWLSDAAGRPVTDRPDARLGLGIYTTRGEHLNVADAEVPSVREAFGHEWVFSQTVVAAPGERIFRALGDGPYLAETAFRLERRNTIDTLVDGELVARMRVDGTGFAAGSTLLSPGTRELEIVTNADPDGEIALVLYERAD